MLSSVFFLFSVILLLFAGWTGSLHPLGRDLGPPLVLCVTKHRRGDARAVGLAAATGTGAAAAVNEGILSICFHFVFDQIS